MERNFKVFLNEYGKGFAKIYTGFFVIPTSFHEAYYNHEFWEIMSNEFQVIEDRRDSYEIGCLFPAYASKRGNKLFLDSESTLHFEL